MHFNRIVSIINSHSFSSPFHSWSRLAITVAVHFWVRMTQQRRRDEDEGRTSHLRVGRQKAWFCTRGLHFNFIIWMVDVDVVAEEDSGETSQLRLVLIRLTIRTC
jgi:hypothetical protein